MTGRRIKSADDPYGENIASLNPGDYGLYYIVTPNGLLGNISKHKVSVHEDGTITVSPSILVRMGEQSWHGYLERGVWREC